MPRAFESYAETQKRLKSWGFACACALCLEKKSTLKTVSAKRKTLQHELEGAVGNAAPRTVHIAKASQTLRRLEQTYPASATAPGAVRLDVWEPYYGLGVAHLAKGAHLQAIDWSIRALEALGFVIAACPRAGGEAKEARRQTRPSLHIARWGLATESAVVVFLYMADAYQSLAPELSAVARRYAETVYTMVAGQETFLDTYPDLK